MSLIKLNTFGASLVYPHSNGASIAQAEINKVLNLRVFIVFVYINQLFK
jgi:hypothetical protein